VDSEAAVRSA